MLATRGGIRIGRIVLPGAAGLGLLFALLVLALKGYRVRAGLSIDMPTNLINFHWGIRPHNIDFIKAWGKRRHDRWAARLLDGRRCFRPLNLLWESVWSGAFLWLWPLYPVGYLMVGRLAMAKMMFADTRCVGCGLCAKYCPNHAIVMVGKKPKAPFWTRRCEACLRCIGFCKQHAIEASHLWFLAILLVTSYFVAQPLRGLAAPLLGAGVALPGLVWDLSSLIAAYLGTLAMYYAFWGMQRLRPVRVFLSYATWTRYFRRRYHDPETQQKQLV